MQSELDRANEKLDRLDALRRGAEEEYEGEKDELVQEKSYWLEQKKTWGDSLAASAQPGNDFVTRRWEHRPSNRVDIVKSFFDIDCTICFSHCC